MVAVAEGDLDLHAREERRGSTRVKNGDGAWKTSRYVPALAAASSRMRPSVSVSPEPMRSSPR